MKTAFVGSLSSDMALSSRKWVWVGMAIVSGGQTILT